MNAQQQLKTYRQSVLNWAFEGKLTNENVQDGELPQGWSMANMSTIIKNAICFYFWDGKDTENTINDAIQRCYYPHPAIEKDLSNEQIKDLFNSYIDKAKKDCFFIVKHEIDTFFSAKIRNFKDFS